MEIKAGVVKELREKTGAGMMDCKAALKESKGDTEKAIEILRKKGLADAKKKAGRAASQGIIESYMCPISYMALQTLPHRPTRLTARCT